MKRPPHLSARQHLALIEDHAPTDEQILRAWDSGMNTADIAHQFSYPEYCVDSRLWRLREERRGKCS